MQRLAHIILALGLLMIPAKTFASDFFVYPHGISVGAGSDMLSVAFDWTTSYSRIIKRTNDKLITHDFWWAVRTRYFYDSDEEQSCIFLQPNVHYLLKIFILDLALGPEIGWKEDTGFDYGGSARIGLLSIAYIEFGYLFNSEKPYVQFLLNAPIGPLFSLFMP
ncbi:MAG: hypothetical protein J5791_06730 [Fibrobacter sp.]|nr:hypothetical protein [Fibrobacter sp.]